MGLAGSRVVVTRGQHQAEELNAPLRARAAVPIAYPCIAIVPQRTPQRLDTALRVLTGGARTAPTRQQTLRATIEWSYDLLEPAERTVLTWLSVFAGGFDLDAAEAVCALVSVSFRAAERDAVGATKTSAIDFGSAPRNATVDPSRENENEDITIASVGARRVIVLLSGSRRCRYDHVCCDAEK